MGGKAMADVDVLIPHYRDVGGLTASLNSVRQQTFTGKVRAIVVDDGSPAPVFAEVRGLVEHAGLEVLLLRNEENRGRPYTRNKLLDAVDAAHLAWLDAGDTWYADKLTAQFAHLKVLAEQGADVDGTWVTCDYDWRWAGKPATLVEQAVEGDQLRAILLGTQLRAYLWSVLCPTRSFKELGGFDEQLPRLQDLDMFIRFIASGGRLQKPHFAAPRALCVYEKSDVGRDSAQIRSCNERIFAKHEPLFRRYGPTFVKQTLLRAELLSARFAKNNGDRRLFAYYMTRALLRAPLRAVRVLTQKAVFKRGVVE